MVDGRSVERYHIRAGCVLTRCTDVDLTDRDPERGSNKRRVYLVGRKFDQALRSERRCGFVLTGSPQGYLVGITVKRQKADRVSWDEVPRSTPTRRKSMTRYVGSLCAQGMVRR